MKRFLIERRFPRGLAIPVTHEGRRDCTSIVKVNAELGVTWMHSYVTQDRTTVFCIYEAPSAEARGPARIGIHCRGQPPLCLRQLRPCRCQRDAVGGTADVSGQNA